ncbi:MAG: hypothetical protein U0Q15_03655 [Kineosporiaceae bacterium]
MTRSFDTPPTGSRERRRLSAGAAGAVLLATAAVAVPAAGALTASATPGRVAAAATTTHPTTPGKPCRSGQAPTPECTRPPTSSPTGTPSAGGIDFEDGGLHGWTPGGRDVKLKVVGKAAQAGGKGLMIRGLEKGVVLDPAHSASVSLPVTAFIGSGPLLRISLQVRLSKPVRNQPSTITDACPGDLAPGLRFTVSGTGTGTTVGILPDAEWTTISLRFPAPTSGPVTLTLDRYTGRLTSAVYVDSIVTSHTDLPTPTWTTGTATGSPAPSTSTARAVRPLCTRR